MPSQKWWVLTAVACGTFMATLDSSIVNIALPTLTKALGSDLSQVKWVVIVYLLVITSLLLPFGRISDLYGRKRTFQLGYIVFTAGSAFCGLALGLEALLLARAMQGIGAAMLMANGPAIITAAFPGNERGKALGTLAMVVSAGLISGPSIGGILITEFGWRSIFLINVPVGIAGAFLVQRFVSKADHPPQKSPFDWAGAFLQMVVLILFIIVMDPPSIAVSGGNQFPIPRIALTVVALIFGAIFLKIETLASHPVFDLSLLRSRTFWTANLASFFTFVSYSAVAVLMPFFLEEVMAYPTDKAGLFMTAIPMTVFIVAPISGRLSDRLGSRGLSAAGAAVGATALFIMSGTFGEGLYEDVKIGGVILALCSVGLSTGLFQSPNNNAIMGAVPTEKLGAASALLATVRNLGLVTGTAIATAVFTWKHETTGDYVQALHFAFFVAGWVAIGAILASLGKRSGAQFEYEHHTPTRKKASPGPDRQSPGSRAKMIEDGLEAERKRTHT